MPTTRAARRAAAARQFLELPADVLSLVLYQLPLAHDIATTGLTCHQLCDAAKLTRKLRPYSGEVVTLAGHHPGYPVVSVVATPDGRIITGSHDGTVKVWRDGTCERTIQAHQEDGVNSVAVLPGGERFVSASNDGTVKLWTLDGALERTFEMLGDYRATCVAALPDGVHFVVGLGSRWEDDGGLRLYDIDGTLVHAFTGYGDEVFSVGLMNDGQHIISGSDDGLVRVWSVASKILVSIYGEEDTEGDAISWIRAVAVTPDGKRVLRGGFDRILRVWLLDGTLENAFSGMHKGMVTALVALPDNQHALSGSIDKTVKLFNINDGAVLRTFTHHTSGVRNLALLPDGLRFVSGSSDNTARIAYHGLAPQ